MWSPLFANLYLLLWFGNFLAKLFKRHTDVTNVKSDRINLCIYVVYSTDLVGCAGAEEDLDYGRIGMGLGVGEGGNISVTDCCPTATPPSSCQLAFRLCRSTLLCGFCAPHSKAEHTGVCGRGPGGGWGSMRSDISVAGVESFCIDVYSCVQKFWRLHLGWNCNLLKNCPDGDILGSLEKMTKVLP